MKDSEERYYDEAKRYEQDLFNAKTKNDELTSELARAKSLKEKAEADTAGTPIKGIQQVDPGSRVAYPTY